MCMLETQWSKFSSSFEHGDSSQLGVSGADIRSAELEGGQKETSCKNV